MTVMVDEPLTQDDAVLRDFLSFDPPEGYRAQLIDGEIVVTPPPGSRHEQNVGEVVWQIAQQSPTKFHYGGNKGLIVPAAVSASRWCRSGRPSPCRCRSRSNSTPPS
ncbi:hypothetical protein [Actinomadura sp. 3N407]|uniref:hypothetical protein n=1 Tax=Actinomadura sp. 3N407 TaxID=3457423 RepID=UPI003FCCBA51